mmetsp:Transcript_172201/g.552002  ORF Transcript_172201/g.552002 Transcript_172201/m.552002 type:complete len:257 (+) Transcript_172201:1449-2219(+)
MSTRTFSMSVSRSDCTHTRRRPAADKATAASLSRAAAAGSKARQVTTSSAPHSAAACSNEATVPPTRNATDTSYRSRRSRSRLAKAWWSHNPAAVPARRQGPCASSSSGDHGKTKWTGPGRPAARARARLSVIRKSKWRSQTKVPPAARSLAVALRGGAASPPEGREPPPPRRAGGFAKALRPAAASRSKASVTRGTMGMKASGSDASRLRVGCPNPRATPAPLRPSPCCGCGGRGRGCGTASWTSAASERGCSSP